MKTGKIQIQVFTSRGKIPVSDATILVKEGREVIALDISNTSGKSRIIEIPVTRNQDPQGVSPPYTSLEVWVEHPDFISQMIEHVKVFPDTESILPVELLPYQEDGSSLVESFVNDLEGGNPWQ
ncbi:MAG: hypothetical protein R3Y63_03965 [Eubacteriales bacterium]